MAMCAQGEVRGGYQVVAPLPSATLPRDRVSH